MQGADLHPAVRNLLPRPGTLLPVGPPRQQQPRRRTAGCDDAVEAPEHRGQREARQRPPRRPHHQIRPTRRQHVDHRLERLPRRAHPHPRPHPPSSARQPVRRIGGRRGADDRASVQIAGAGRRVIPARVALVGAQRHQLRPRARQHRRRHTAGPQLAQQPLVVAMRQRQPHRPPVRPPKRAAQLGRPRTVRPRRQRHEPGLDVVRHLTGELLFAGGKGGPQILRGRDPLTEAAADDSEPSVGGRRPRSSVFFAVDRVAIARRQVESAVADGRDEAAGTDRLHIPLWCPGLQRVGE